MSTSDEQQIDVHHLFYLQYFQRFSAIFNKRNHEMNSLARAIHHDSMSIEDFDIYFVWHR